MVSAYIKFKIIFLDCFYFFISPSFKRSTKINTNSIKGILFVGIASYLIMIGVIVITSISIIVPLRLLDIVPPQPTHSNINILLMILVAPVFEELVFRLPLLFSRRNILISIAILLFFLNKKNLPFAIILSLSVIFISYILLNIKRNKIERILKYFWYKHYHIVFYLFVCIFGVVHITNFQDLSTTQYFFIPVIVLPQIIMGFYLGYVRVRFNNGMFICIFLHILTNFFACLPRLF
jgi:hypothetical protein